MVRREVPVSTMPWQPWEHQPEVVPPIRKLNGKKMAASVPTVRGRQRGPPTTVTPVTAQRQAILEEGKGTPPHITLESLQSHMNGH